MPVGWRKAFGEKMCEEIMEELVAHDLVDSYRVTEIKEKYAELRWYDWNSTDKIQNEIIPKYTELSRRICIRCGESATKISLGWISPYCDKCAEELSRDWDIEFEFINEQLVDDLEEQNIEPGSVVV